jgi:beta-N-acetylglucosaminidase
MDPRNFLDANDIYIFLEQSYDSKTQTVKGIEKMVDGTFMDAKITKKGDKHYGKRFAEVILYAAKQSKVNAYVLVSTIIQEQGRSGSKLSKGTSYNGKTVYNYFNYMASGSSSSAIINNGAKYAYSQKWFTPTEALVSGAKKYGSGYINEKQDTYYYKNFNVRNPDNLIHQYAQHVADTVRSAVTIRKTYADYTDLKLTFRIPVFKSMPETVSKLPSKNSKYNNYYFENLKATGLTKFNRHTTSYTLTAKSDLTVTYELPKNATYAGESYYALKKGSNKIKLGVKSQTGYVKEYTLNITASKALNLLVVPKSGETLVKKSNGKWYHYRNGKKTTDTTLFKFKDKWFYIKDGVWTKDTTLVEYKDKWFYVVDGKWTTQPETLYKHNNTWIYINKGKWDKETETLVEYSGKQFYVKNGKWAKKTQIYEFNDEQYYLLGGIVQTDFIGEITLNDKTYYIENGKVTEKPTAEQDSAVNFFNNKNILNSIPNSN